MIGLIILVALIGVAFWQMRRRSVREGTWLGLAGARAAFLWDNASAQQRDLMLSAINVTEGHYHADLMNKGWAQLPELIQMALAQTFDEIRREAAGNL